MKQSPTLLWLWTFGLVPGWLGDCLQVVLEERTDINVMDRILIKQSLHEWRVSPLAQGGRKCEVWQCSPSRCILLSTAPTDLKILILQPLRIDFKGSWGSADGRVCVCQKPIALQMKLHSQHLISPWRNKGIKTNFSNRSDRIRSLDQKLTLWHVIASIAMKQHLLLLFKYCIITRDKNHPEP